MYSKFWGQGGKHLPTKNTIPVKSVLQKKKKKRRQRILQKKAEFVPTRTAL